MNSDIVVKGQEIEWKQQTFPCAIGQKGFTHNKKEGDKCTPIGRFPLRKIFVRSDRIGNIMTNLPLQEITPQDGWCDDPKDPNYNQFIRKPFLASHEHLWRNDHVYDIIIAVGYNDNPVCPEKGSAIFIHLLHENNAPTQGCIALKKENLLKIIPELSCKSHLVTIGKST